MRYTFPEVCLPNLRITGTFRVGDWDYMLMVLNTVSEPGLNQLLLYRTSR